MEAFDQETSWIGRGEAPGMPAFMHSRNHFEFIDQGDSIRYEQPVFGIVRTIQLDSAENPLKISRIPLSDTRSGRWKAAR